MPELQNMAMQRKIDELVRVHGNRVGEILERAMERLQLSLLPYVSGSEIGGAGFADVVASMGAEEIAGILQSAGYLEFQGELQLGYQEIIVEAGKRLQGVRDQAVNVRGASINAYQNSLDNDLAEFQKLGISHAQSIKSVLEQMTISPIQFRDAIKLLEGVGDATKAKLTTQINTGLATVQRRLHQEVAAQIPEALFLYQGPTDSRTRGFCKALIGKALTRQQLNRLNNHQGLPVRTSGGGWNCRHDLLPMTPGFAARNNIKMATPADITRANRSAAKRT